VSHVEDRVLEANIVKSFVTYNLDRVENAKEFDLGRRSGVRLPETMSADIIIPARQPEQVFVDLQDGQYLKSFFRTGVTYLASFSFVSILPCFVQFQGSLVYAIKVF
jgi:hypothetical protein